MRAISLAERGRLADQTVPASPFAGLVANLGSDFGAKLCGRSAAAITLIEKRSDIDKAGHRNDTLQDTVSK